MNLGFFATEFDNLLNNQLNTNKSKILWFTPILVEDLIRVDGRVQSQTYPTIANIKLFSASLTDFSELNHIKIYKELAAKRIKRNFSPPASPWVNGAIKDIAKITKKALKTVVSDLLFIEEVLAMYYTEIESLINERSLIPISDDVSDMEALTRNCFVLGRSNPSVNISRKCFATIG